MLRYTCHVCLFLVGLLLTAWGIRSLDRELPFWGGTQHRFVHLLDEGEQYDTLFLGSSRVARGFDPDTFDAEMERLGSPCHSYNIGFQGLRQHDYDPILDWLIEHRPQQLRRLMIELHAFVQGPRNSNWMTGREIGMHTWQHLGSRLWSIWHSRVDFGARCEQTLHATAHTLVNLLRVGQAVRILDWNLARSRGDLPWPRRDEDHRGWQPLDAETMDDPQRLAQHRRWVGRRDRALETLASKRRDLTPPSHCGGFNVEALRSQAARLRAAGIEPIYVVMPHYAFNFYGRDGVAEVADELRILEFDVVADNEDLHEFDLWFDHAHMNRDGGTVFSRRLARAVRALE